MNVEGFKELKRVLSKVPQREFNISNWKYCACGHATHDQWFQRQGFTSCHNFNEAAAFFGVSYTEAKALFSGQPGCLVTQRMSSNILTRFSPVRWRAGLWRATSTPGVRPSSMACSRRRIRQRTRREELPRRSSVPSSDLSGRQQCALSEEPAISVSRRSRASRCPTWRVRLPRWRRSGPRSAAVG